LWGGRWPYKRGGEVLKARKCEKVDLRGKNQQKGRKKGKTFFQGKGGEGGPSTTGVSLWTGKRVKLEKRFERTAGGKGMGFGEVTENSAG